MRISFLIICITFVLHAHAQKINWNNVGPFPIEEKGGVIFYNIEGEKCSEVLYDRDQDYRYISGKYGIYPVKENGLWGCINHDGKQIIPCEYNNQLWPIIIEGEVYIPVTNRSTGLWGVLNAYGKTIIPCEYKEIKTLEYSYPKMYHLFFVQKTNGKWGAINTKGDIVIPVIYDEAQSGRPSNLGLVFFREGDRWGGFNENGKNVLPFIFNFSAQQPMPTKQNVIVQTMDKTWFACDKNGNKKKLNIDSGDHLDRYPDDNLLVVSMPHKGDALFDVTSNKYVSGRFYEIALEYQRKFVADVKTTNGYKSFIINDKGQRISSNEYDECHSLDYGYIKVKKNNKYGVIDYNDRIIIPFEYENFNDIEELTPNLFAVGKNGKYGIVNLNNQKVVDFLYDQIDIDNNTKLLEVIKDNKYSFLNINFDLATSWVNDRLNLEVEKYHYLYSVEKSDVDENIPYNNKKNSDTYVVIIANENYDENNISKVQFANNDGKVLRDYCIQTLGVPQNNIKYIENATLNKIRSTINWICNTVKSQENQQTNVIFYYSGHGMPDEASRNAYILPSDGIANDYQSGYSLETLYKQLGELQTAKTIVILDACFSGASRDGKMILADSKGVVIKPKPAQPKGNMVILSASQGDETAYPYKKKKHGMFTYFLLKKLQETNGNVSLGELETYLNKKVSQQSLIEVGKLQTPSTSVSNSLSEKWKDLKIY